MSFYEAAFQLIASTLTCLWPHLSHSCSLSDVLSTSLFLLLTTRLRRSYSPAVSRSYAVSFKLFLLFLCTQCCSLDLQLSAPAKEDFLPDPMVAVGSGYSESKWVAERILANASAAVPSLRTVVIRVGQMSGGASGDWNAAEWLPSLVASAPVVRCLPNLNSVSLSPPMLCLPVTDLAPRMLRGYRSMRQPRLCSSSLSQMPATCLLSCISPTQALHLGRPWSVTPRSNLAYRLCRMATGCRPWKTTSRMGQKQRCSTCGRTLLCDYWGSTARLVQYRSLARGDQGTKPWVWR
jgi:hypothetical protein